MTASPVPDLADVLAARQRITPYLRPTPLYHYPALEMLTGAPVWVKHENHQPVGAFKEAYSKLPVKMIKQVCDQRQHAEISAAAWGFE